MKIVCRVTGYPPTYCGGSEINLHSLLRPLVRRGHQVRVWTALHGEVDEARTLDGVFVQPISNPRTHEDDIRTADIIVSQDEELTTAAKMAYKYRKPFVVTCDLPAKYSRQFTALAGYTALAVVNSQHMREVAQKHFSRCGGPGKVIIVRPPVLSSEYATTPGERVTLVNLNRGKGGYIFWELADRLPHVPFLGVRGAYGEQIVRERPNVKVLSSVPPNRMRDLVYAHTRVLLVPTDHESWSRCSVEAMMSGIPVLAHPSPGVVEALGGAGIFVDREDVDGWEAQVRRLLDQRTWRSASSNALRRAGELDPTNDLIRWVEAIESLCSTDVC